MTANKHIIKVTNEYGHNVDYYDDGFGPCWVFYDSLGVTGVIRAQTFEEAHEIAEDEMYPEADEATWEDLAKECGYEGTREGNLEGLVDDAVFQENYGFRPNGANVRDKHGHGIYQKDLNGNDLMPLKKWNERYPSHKLTVRWEIAE